MNDRRNQLRGQILVRLVNISGLSAVGNFVEVLDAVTDIVEAHVQAERDACADECRVAVTEWEKRGAAAPTERERVACTGAASASLQLAKRLKARGKEA